MSFILEALKKSEQQQKRQQQNTAQQEVRKRTLTLSPRLSGWRPYRKALVIPLVVVSGWFLHSWQESPQAPSPSADRELPPPALVNQAKTSALQSALQQHPLSSTEPSPIPRGDITVPSTKQVYSSAEPPRTEDELPTEPLATNENALIASAVPSEREADAAALSAPQPSQPLLFNDLSKELRETISPLTMSMHYYSTDPRRSLVRINDRLLHEGDWLNSDLQLVAITPAGATLSFMGRAFTLPSLIR